MTHEICIPTALGGARTEALVFGALMPLRALGSKVFGTRRVYSVAQRGAQLQRAYGLREGQYNGTCILGLAAGASVFLGVMGAYPVALGVGHVENCVLEKNLIHQQQQAAWKMGSYGPQLNSEVKFSMGR